MNELEYLNSMCNENTARNIFRCIEPYYQYYLQTKKKHCNFDFFPYHWIDTLYHEAKQIIDRLDKGIELTIRDIEVLTKSQVYSNSLAHQLKEALTKDI